MKWILQIYALEGYIMFCVNGRYVCETILNNFGRELQEDSLQFPTTAPPIAAILLQLWHQNRKWEEFILFP